MKREILPGILLAILASCNKQTPLETDQHPMARQAIQIETAAPPDKGIVRNANGNISASKVESGVTGWFYTGAWFPSDAAHNIQGLSAVADYKKLRLGSVTMRTYWLAFYYTSTLADGTLQRRWLQFGYINDAFSQRLFLDAFNQGAPGGTGEYNVPTSYFNTFTYPSINTKVEFKIAYVSGTTFRISIGGSDWVDVDLQTDVIADALNYAQIMTESQDAMTFPDQINTSNCSVLKNGNWSIIDTARIQTATWPIEGNNQNADLAPAEFNMGGSKGTIYPTPTQLW